jgi:glycosyltransferase involved in cell wall biosynthesis
MASTAAVPQSKGPCVMPRVSIITPTMNRQKLLPALWDCIRAQSVQDIEWLIHDGSSQPASMFDPINDPRVRYMHVPEAMTIGAKRNDLCRAANGEIIVHFDDDDFYGPHYIQGMISYMTAQNASFVKLFGFFLYQQTHKAFAYWDLERAFPIHFHVAPDRQPYLVPNNAHHMSDKWGFGFSFVFHRTVWEAVQFPDQNHGEDQKFADAVVARFKSDGKQDFDRTCLHIIHTSNTSAAFPQQILPTATLPQAFPDFRSQL